MGAPVAPGQVLAGRYRVTDELLGAGRAGHVVAARDELLRRRVAVKILDGIGDGVAARRAVRAARAASAVLDPRVMRVLDLGDRLDDQTPFLVLEYLEGTPLDVLLARGPLPDREAARLRADLLDAVAALHQAGAVHRDLRAENVLVTAGGVARVTSAGLTEATRDRDLGLRLGGEPIRADGPSPEQRRGAPASARSDVYALAVLLGSLLPETTADVAAVLHRATVIDPARRYADADALRGALQSLAPRPSPRRPVLDPTAPLESEEAWQAARRDAGTGSGSPAPDAPDAPDAPVGAGAAVAAGAGSAVATGSGSPVAAAAGDGPEPQPEAAERPGDGRRRLARGAAALGVAAAVGLLGVRLAQPADDAPEQAQAQAPAPREADPAGDRPAADRGGSDAADRATTARDDRVPAAAGAGAPGTDDDAADIDDPAGTGGAGADAVPAAATEADTADAAGDDDVDPRYADLVAEGRARGDVPELVDGLAALDDQRGSRRAASVAGLFGLAAIDAGAGTPSADFSARVRDLLRGELSLAGVAALAAEEDGADAERLAALPDVRGEDRAVEAADLYGRAAVDELAVSAPLRQAAIPALEPELSLEGLADLAERDPAAQGPASAGVAADLRRLPTLQGQERSDLAALVLREVWTRVATGELARPYGQAVTDAVRPLVEA